MKKITNIIFIIYLILLTWLVLFKLVTDVNMIPSMRNINLLPFGESVIINGKLYVKEIIYNMLAFVPLGVYISIIKKDYHLYQKVLIGFLLSLFFEVIQYTFSIGSSDITDVIVNTFGTFLGVYLYKLLCKYLKDKAVKVINIVGLLIELTAIILLVLLTIFNR